MAILVTGNTYAANDQVTSTNLNAAVNSATFASGAVDNLSTQLGGVSGDSIIVKDGGISPQKLDSTASYTVGSLTVTSAIDTSIITADLLKLAPETGYTTSGTIALNLSVASNARILLADDSVFTVAGQAAGEEANADVSGAHEQQTQVTGNSGAVVDGAEFGNGKIVGQSKGQRDGDHEQTG